MGRQVVKNVKYDHLKQVQSLEVAQLKVVEWPRDNTVDQNLNRLRAYAQSKQADIVFDDIDAISSNVTGRGRLQKRGNRDLCYSLMTVSCFTACSEGRLLRMLEFTIMSSGQRLANMTNRRKAAFDAVHSTGPARLLAVPIHLEHLKAMAIGELLLTYLYRGALWRSLGSRLSSTERQRW